MEHTRTQGLTEVIRRLYNDAPVHVGAVHVEVVDGEAEMTVWDGDVGIFTLQDHPIARHCYAWAEHHNGYSEYVVVPAVPPVNSAQMAVRLVLERRAAALG